MSVPTLVASAVATDVASIVTSSVPQAFVRAAEETEKTTTDNWQHVFGLVLLAFGAACLVMQFIALLKPPVTINPEAKKKLEEAADKVVDAAEKTQAAASNISGARRILGLDSGHEFEAFHLMSDDGRQLVNAIAAEEEAVESDAAEAKQKADEAKAEVSSSASSLTGIAGAVAGKYPLIGAALLFALFGCWVAGLIEISLG